MPSSKTGGGKFSWENATTGKQSYIICVTVKSSVLEWSFIHASDLCRLGLYREAEKQFRSALNHQEIVDTYLYLAKVVASNLL